MKKLYVSAFRLKRNAIIFIAVITGAVKQSHAQSILIQENFTTYQGTAATVPAGWIFTTNGDYTSAANSGPSGPNSYKFGTNGATITTPFFSNPDSVSFWLKGVSTDTVSSLDALYTTDNINWNPISTIKPIPTSGTIKKYAVPSAAIALQFTYTKSAGNVAFDDFLLTGINAAPSSSSGKILIYFNQPVDNSVSTGENAIYLNQTADDTLIAYINRAKNTIDIAQYDYNQSSGYSNIATALNNAYAKGIKIRYIYDGAASNTGLAALNAGIPKLASPTGANYNIMHNKFVILDGRWKSSNALNSWVNTSSFDWNANQFNNDYNNMVCIQDSALAHVYTAEFNMMWGDTGMTSNSTNSKFGPYKTDLGKHNFTIGGHLVELYFSPSDGTNNHILSSISSANTDLYFGVYTLTLANDADSLVAKKNSGVYVAGIVDQYTASSSPTTYNILTTGLGSMLKEYTGSYIYHSKYLIADPSNTCSDPLVLTGSHNWTNSADTKNDENTLIIHDDTIANIYYQAFHKDFYTLGGTLAIPAPCVIGVSEVRSSEFGVEVYPNPSSGMFTLEVGGQTTDARQVEIYNVYGERVYSASVIGRQSSVIRLDAPSGIYFLQMSTEQGTVNKKIIINK
ncbi:MAG: T9SS type A sorting domain-containing protein [Bacteroidetes bacterium]|nr:T9SS type A sorting domain-containing protein [Bacteroidota bacterium]